jgi:hypothetical protein
MNNDPQLSYDPDDRNAALGAVAVAVFIFLAMLVP